MKKNHFLFISLLILLSFISCSNDYEEKTIDNKENIINQDELETAFNAIKEFSELDNNMGTKSFPNKDMIIKDIQVSKLDVDISKNIKTKSSASIPDNTDINIYTISFNIGENQGFAMATGDERLTRVYAYTASGSIEDTIYNKGLAMTLAQIPYICEEDLLLSYDSTLLEYAQTVELEDDLSKKTKSSTYVGDGYYIMIQGC
ncbi:MAG: Spi family protease inhibitor [Prevotella sp.]|jgi:hypothetical protein|nr:Spi family protease inhibitor [Prevotella sp.]